MKLTLRIGAAMGIVALAGCNQGGEENYSENADLNAGYANEIAPLPDDNISMDMNMGNETTDLNATDTGNTEAENTTNYQ